METKANAHEFDVFIPRLDLFDASDLAALLGIPYGAGLIGIRVGSALALYYQDAEPEMRTWADQLHLATLRVRDGELPALTVPEVLVQRVGVYDPRDGTATLDSSGRATRLVREWLGSKRRHISEEVFTSAYPEHPRRRVVLFSLRSGDVPVSVRAYAQRNGLEGLFDVTPAAAAPSTPKPAGAMNRRPSTIALTPVQIRELAIAVARGGDDIDHIDVRADGAYRLHATSDGDHTWQRMASELGAAQKPARKPEPAAPEPATESAKRPALHPSRPLARAR